MKINYWTILLVFVLLDFRASYANDCASWRSEFATRNNLRIGNIDINARNIFDSKKAKENKAIHQWANKLHIQTKPSVISSLLLFSEGGVFDQAKLAETERNIRKQRYIKSASVRAKELCGNRVNIQVISHDNWTLTPGLSFSRQGGENRSGIEIQEHNLLGLGKSLSFNYKKNSKRNSNLFSYNDPQLFGSRNRLSLNLQDNTDGKGYKFELERPFYELDSKSAWGLKTLKLKQATSIYKSGKTVDKITEENKHHSVFYGWSKKSHKTQKKNEYLRFKVGWTYDKSDYLKSLTNNLFKPKSLVESYPWFELEHSSQHFVKKTNFRTMGRIEDVSLGKSLTLGAGLLLKELGSDDNHLKLSASFSNGYELGRSNLGFITFQGISYLGDGFRKGKSLSVSAELNHFNEKGNDYSLSGSFKTVSNLKLTEQLYLGGESGFRGYPKAYQAGNKSLAFRAEKRFHFDWYPLHLSKFGVALFSEVGSVWGDTNNAKLLADVGIGFRIVPTHSSSGKTLHFDLGFPLVDRGKVKKYQFTIRTSNRF